MNTISQQIIVNVKLTPLFEEREKKYKHIHFLFVFFTLDVMFSHSFCAFDTFPAHLIL